jgi:putative spermidine/putrescine transport system permease protein
LAEPARVTLPERAAGWALRVVAAGVLLFLVAPILVVVPLPFSADAYFSYPLRGLSWRWYEAVLRSDDWRRALLNSLAIGLGSTALATVLGTLARSASRARASA